MTKNVVVLEPGFMDRAIHDKKDNQLSPEELREYWDDVFDAGVPMSKEAAKWLWNKWGERLGLPEPK